MVRKIHDVEIIKSNETYLHLLIDGMAYRIRWADCSPKLKQATQIERDYLEISPSGYGIHWPLIDEDLAIKPLLTRAEKLAGEEEILAHLGKPINDFRR